MCGPAIRVYEDEGNANKFLQDKSLIQLTVAIEVNLFPA